MDFVAQKKIFISNNKTFTAITACCMFTVNRFISRIRQFFNAFFGINYYNTAV